MAEVDDAEAVAVGVGEDDEVGVVGVAVPVDPLGAERDESIGLARLLCGVGDVEVEVDAGVRRRWCLAALQGELGTGAVGRGQHDRPTAEPALHGLVAQRRRPELLGAATSVTPRATTPMCSIGSASRYVGQPEMRFGSA